MERLIIFDLDGTLAEPEYGQSVFRKTGEGYSWLPQRYDMLLDLHKQAYIAVATNQGGIAAGHLTYDETEQAIYNLLRTLPFYVPFLFEPYSWTEQANGYEIYLPWRKPSPVMLLKLAEQYPLITQQNVLCIGDREEDRTAARYAGFRFEWAGSYFTAWKEGLA